MQLNELAEICSKKCGLGKSRPLVAGVSGGADSLSLVDCLAALGYPLVVAHFDHRLRPDSQADAEFVRTYADKNGLLFEGGDGEVAVFANDHSLSIEEAARQMRYSFLFDVARRHHAQAVAVGHTADDQVETVLMHILRGAGLDGLRGMPWRGILEVFDPAIPLVRPLLGVWRSKTEEWCRTRGLEARNDPTNRDTTYARNHLRQEILPLLESYSPQARRHIWQMADHLQGDQRVLAQLAGEKYQACLKQSGQGYVGFDQASLSVLDPALQARVMRQAAFQLVKELRDFDTAAVERCLAAIASAKTGWQADLPGGIRMRVENGSIYLLTWAADLPGSDWPQLQSGVVAELNCPGEVALGNGWRITLARYEAIETARKAAFENSDPNQAWLDADEINLPLVVKRAAAGQRFQPLGMPSGSQKLSDFWVNVKLPRPARSGWPVIFINEKVVWLPGFRPGHAFRLTDHSRSAVLLRLFKTGKN